MTGGEGGGGTLGPIFAGYVLLQFLSHLVGTLGCRSQFTYICAGLSSSLNVESNGSWCWQSFLTSLWGGGGGGGTAKSVPTNMVSIVAFQSPYPIIVYSEFRDTFIN